jgi:hypothetical protein
MPTSFSRRAGGIIVIGVIATGVIVAGIIGVGAGVIIAIGATIIAAAGGHGAAVTAAGSGSAARAELTCLKQGVRLRASLLRIFKGRGDV